MFVGIVMTLVGFCIGVIFGGLAMGYSYERKKNDERK